MLQQVQQVVLTVNVHVNSKINTTTHLEPMLSLQVHYYLQLSLHSQEIAFQQSQEFILKITFTIRVVLLREESTSTLTLVTLTLQWGIITT